MIQAILGLALFVAVVVGYILNIVKLCGMVGFGGLLVLRAIGIFFPPLGVILGYVG